MPRFTQSLFIACAICLSLFFVALPQPASAQGASNKWTPWFEIGGKLSSELHGGEAEVFIPMLGDDDTLVFVDLEGRIFEDSIRDGNVALGIRQMLNNGFNAGGWIGYAPFRSSNGEVYHGIAGGLELLSHNFDVRISGFLPFNDDRTISRMQAFSSQTIAELGTDQFPTDGWIYTDLTVVTTDTTTTTTVREYAMRGIDGEVGGLLPLPLGNTELRGYVGGYFFDGDMVEDIGGFKSRLELRVLDVIPDVPGSRLTAEAGYRYDDVFDHQGFIGARLRIPLGGADPTQTQIAQLNGQERRMLDSIQREDPLAQTNTTVDVNIDVTREPGEDALTDVPFDRVALVGNNGTDLQAAIDDAGGNSLIIANGGAVNFQSVVFQDNQTLMGGGGAILVRGQGTGNVMTFSAPGTRPTIEALGFFNPGAIMANNSHIADLDIIGDGGRFDGVPGNHGVRGAGLTNVVVEQLNISMMGRNGISFDAGTDLLIFGNNVSDVFSNGINIRDDNTNVTILDNVVSNVRISGINVFDGNTNVTIAGNAVDDIGDDGIDFGNDNTNVIVANNTTSNTGDKGIDFDFDNTNLTIANNRVTNAGGDGISFNDRNINVTVSNNTIVMSGDGGIVFDDDNTDVTVMGNNITDVGGNGISFSDNNLAVTVANNVISNTNDDGIRFSNINTDVIIRDNTINDAGSRGVFLGDLNDSVTVTGNTVNGAVRDAFFFFSGNTNLVITNNVVAGNIGDDAFDMGDGLFGDNVIANGAGNTAAGAIIGGDLCEGDGVFTGDLIIDGVVFNDAANNCS